VSSQAEAPRLFATMRRDRWWLPPLATGVGLAAFGVYSIVVAALGKNFLYTEDGARYLSPFYSPDIRSWGIDITRYAFFVMWVPLGLRLTCYYYRKAYYRAFFMAPPACAVHGANRRYTGETKLPFVLQNVHRYFLYLATVVLGFLWYDAIRAFFFDGSFGIGLGTLIMLANVCFLTLFTFGCNSARHLVGGCLECFAGHRSRYRLWRGITRLNVRHMEWAWISLCSVALTDLYIRLAAAGVFHDPRIL
jgi:hypothetical protein